MKKGNWLVQEKVKNLEKIVQLIKLVESRKEFASEQKIITHMALSGHSEKKIKEYIDLLIKSGQISRGHIENQAILYTEGFSKEAECQTKL